MELVRNKHLFSISHIKYGNVGGENRCFMTTNTPTLRALLILSKEKNQTLGTLEKL
jgi:hypothetical protein